MLLFLAAGPSPEPPTPKSDLAPSLSPCAGSLSARVAYRDPVSDKPAGGFPDPPKRPPARIPGCLSVMVHCVITTSSPLLNKAPAFLAQNTTFSLLDGICSPVNHLDAYRVLDCSWARDCDCASLTD